jgi:hypothetical protein
VAVPEVREVRVHQDVVPVLDAPIVPGVHAVPVYPDQDGARAYELPGHGQDPFLRPGTTRRACGHHGKPDDVLTGLPRGTVYQRYFQPRSLIKLLGSPAEGAKQAI